MERKNPLSSSEIGGLWITYQQKTLILRVLEYFIEKVNDQEARNIFGLLWQELSHSVKILIRILDEGEIAIPVGFTNQDVNLEAPKLFDNGLDILILRIIKEISLGMYTLNLNMSYREDVMSLYENLRITSQKVYKLCTHYLLERGILTSPPILSPPKTSRFVDSQKYLQGLNPLGRVRPLNYIEIGYLHHKIEINNVALQVFTAFAQVVENMEIKRYLQKGNEVTQRQIKLLHEILQTSNVQISSTPNGTVTSSTIAPFSQKLIMFLNFLFNGYLIVEDSFGTMFCLRNDISLKSVLLAKDDYLYNDEGVKLMIKNHWFEEPPQMEGRPS